MSNQIAYNTRDESFMPEFEKAKTQILALQDEYESSYKDMKQQLDVEKDANENLRSQLLSLKTRGRMERHTSERSIRKPRERSNSKMFASVSSFTPKGDPTSKDEKEALVIKRVVKKRKNPSKKSKPAQSFRNVKSAKYLPK